MGPGPRWSVWINNNAVRCGFAATAPLAGGFSFRLPLGAGHELRHSGGIGKSRAHHANLSRLRQGIPVKTRAASARPGLGQIGAAIGQGLGKRRLGDTGKRHAGQAGHDAETQNGRAQGTGRRVRANTAFL